MDLAGAVGKGQWKCGVTNLPMGTLEFSIEGWKVVCRQVSILETLCRYLAMNIMHKHSKYMVIFINPTFAVSYTLFTETRKHLCTQIRTVTPDHTH